MGVGLGVGVGSRCSGFVLFLHFIKHVQGYDAGAVKRFLPLLSCPFAIRYYKIVLLKALLLRVGESKETAFTLLNLLDQRRLEYCGYEWY